MNYESNPPVIVDCSVIRVLGIKKGMVARELSPDHGILPTLPSQLWKLLDELLLARSEAYRHTPALSDVEKNHVPHAACWSISVNTR